MKLRSSCCPNCIACTGSTAHLYYLLNVLLILCAFSLTRIHSKVIHRHQNLDQPGPSQEHQEMAADFKHSLLRHAELQGLPVVDQQGTAHTTAFNMANNSTIRRKIREFMRSLRGDDEDYVDDVQQVPRKFIFRSSGLKKKELHKRIKSQLNKSTLKSFRFMTKVEQPEDLYLELVMKTAVLRMRTRLHKDQLQSGVKKAAKTLNVGVYLHRTSQAPDEEEFVPLASGTIKLGRNFKLVEIPLNTQIFSQILDNDDNTVLLTVTFDDSNENSAPAKDSETNDQVYKRVKAPLKVQISKPFIEITTRTRDLNSRRDKRNTETSPCEEDMCCLRSINITMKEIGWDSFVLYPPAITFNYCKGWCPNRYKAKSLSTSVQAKLHERFPGTVPPPSCVATGYRSIEVLMLNNKWVEYSDLIVTGCMCS